jgi:ABC transporter DrrB family efflux protein
MFVITSISTLRERRGGTLERLLTLPISKLDFILGYALAFGLLAILQAAIAVGFAVWVCGLTIEGSIWLLRAVAVADAVLGTALGLLASAVAQTEFQVVQFMPAFVFPQILLGGLLLPREDMPDVLHAISDWLPLSHAIDALNAVARDTEDAGYVGVKLLVIAAFIVGAIVLGSISLRRRTP